jgi:predicted nucleic acid-binding protein
MNRSAGSAVAVDTDVASFRFKRDTRRERYRPHLDGRQLVISFMTLAELEAWAKERHWEMARRTQLGAYIAGFTIDHSDAVLCGWWATVRAIARQGARPNGVADARVAATALRNGVPLVTHNPSHFAGVAGLTIITERPS